MDKKYLNDIISWDVTNWSRSLDFWKKYLRPDNNDKSALELGANRGGLSLWLTGYAKHVICSDLESPENTAKELHQAYGIGNQISYAAIDATNIPDNNKIDIIAFKSMLGGIGRNDNIDLQKQAIDQMYAALKPGGTLLFAENLIGSPVHQYFRKRFVNWGTEWRYVNIDEMQNFTSQFREIHYVTVGFLGAFGRREWQRKILGSFDRLVFNHIVPASWRYIIIGVAIK